MAADPRMTKAITTTTKKKKKYEKYYCDLLQTTTKQCNHSLYGIMQIHFKTTATPGCLPHRHSGRRRKELDRISIGAAKLRDYSIPVHGRYKLLSFTQSRMQINTAHTGHRNTSCLSTCIHIQRFDILQEFKENKNKNNPATLCELELTSSQKWRYWLSTGVMNFRCIKKYFEDFPQSPTDKHHRMQSSLNLTIVLKCTVVHL